MIQSYQMLPKVVCVVPKMSVLIKHGVDNEVSKSCCRRDVFRAEVFSAYSSYIGLVSNFKDFSFFFFS